MLTVGLTGGIASGKTHVRRRFATAGLHTTDLDLVSREVMSPGGAAYGEVVAAFGREIVAADGTIDRRVLGRQVFADAGARRRLEAIVHPRIRDAEAALLARASDGVAIVDAALLVETGTHLRFDRLVVAFCEPREQLRRLRARDGISEAEARARIDAQMAPEEKRRFGHYVIDSSDALADTDVRTDAVIAAIRGLATQPEPPVRITADTVAVALDCGPQRGPRGLTPWQVVDEIGAAGTLDLARMTALLRPAQDGPWYEAAEAAPDQPAETLAIPIASWAEGRRPGDEAFAIAAAASLARLTHRSGAAISGAVLAALAAQHALAGKDPSSLGTRLDGWAALATAWTGHPPPTSSVHTVRAAAAHPGDGERASRAAGLTGGLPLLARALAGGPGRPTVADRAERVAHLLGTRPVRHV